MVINKNNLMTISLLLLLSLLFNLFCLNSVSVLTEHEGYDSCVFKQMGLALLQGKELYRDLFDHKGPVIFYINAFAQYLNIGRWGLFLLHVLNYTIVFYIWYKICLFFKCTVKDSFVVILSAIMIYLSLTGIEGNRIEDWIMIPISYSIYIGLKELLYRNSSIYDYLMLGIFSAIIIFMRANSGVILFCTFILLLYQFYTHRNFNRIKLVISYTILGFLVVSLCIFLHFFIRWGWQGIDNLLFGTFIFNFSVFNNVVEINGWYTYLVLLSLFAILLFFSFYKRIISTNLFIYLLGSFALTYILIGRAKYDYYLIIIIPLYIPILASIFSWKKKYILFFFILFLLAKYKIIRENVSNTIVERNRYHNEYRMVDTIMDRIPEDERSSIWNYNANVDGLQILQRKQLTQCNMVLWNHQLNYSERLRNAIDGQLEKQSPSWIIVEKGKPYIKDVDSVFICSNYHIADSLQFTNRVYGKKMVFYFFKKNLR